jgi:molecular chaperone DnaJ
MPVVRSHQTRDMYVEVVAETPQKLTKRQRELLSEFEKLSLKDAYPDLAERKASEPVGAQAGSA